ncbi:MAG: hypothetical protein ACLP8S_01080 [Solirubrobacteraceae bacterium]
MSAVGESDGVREMVEETARAAVILAATIARRVQAHRQRQLEQAQQESAARVAELHGALARERALEVARASAVLDDAWWTPERTPGEVAEMWQPIAETIARDPHEADPTLQRGAERIVRESHDRWGIDVMSLTHLARAQELEREQQTLTARGSSDPAVVRELARVEVELQQARALAPEPEPAVASDAVHNGAARDTARPDHHQYTGREDRLEVLQSSLEAAGVSGEGLEARMLAEAAFSGPPERSLGAGNLHARGRTADHAQAREVQRHR